MTEPSCDVYETSGGGYMALGAIEPQVRSALWRVAALDMEIFGKQMDPSRWPQMRESLDEAFRSKTRAAGT